MKIEEYKDFKKNPKMNLVILRLLFGLLNICVILIFLYIILLNYTDVTLTKRKP